MESRRGTPAFTRKDVVLFVPTVTESQLRDWKRSRLLEPSVINFSAQGFQSYWSVRDVLLVEFSARLVGGRFGSFPLTIPAVDKALPRRLDDLSLDVEFYWNGGEIHLVGRDDQVAMSLEERSYVGDLFSVRGSLRERYDEALKAAQFIDVVQLIATPDLARGKRSRVQRL